jgi:cholera toxin transcriptional activator
VTDTTVTTGVIKFDEFELDLGRYELRRGGRAVKLEKIPMELLILLAERQGQLVTREEIIQKLWGDSVFVDTRQGVNTAIRKIRLALKDDPDQPRILETVVGKGYRLAAPVIIASGVLGAAVTSERVAAEPTSVDTQPSSLTKGTEPSASAALTETEAVAIGPTLARAFFLFIQVGYLIMYAAAFINFAAIRRVGLPPAVPIVTLVVGLIGTAVRVYLLSSVAVGYSAAARLFQRMFPGVLVLDVIWAAAPLLLYHKLGELTLLFMAAMAFLPFAQRTLMVWIYGRQTAESRRQ